MYVSPRNVVILARNSVPGTIDDPLGAQILGGPFRGVGTRLAFLILTYSPDCAWDVPENIENLSGWNVVRRDMQSEA